MLFMARPKSSFMIRLLQAKSSFSTTIHTKKTDRVYLLFDN